MGAAGGAAGSGFVGVGGAAGQAFRADPASGLPLSADIVAQIVAGAWDEPLAGHVIPGTAGGSLGTVPAQVWDELLALHLGAGSTGAALNVAQTASTPAAVAAAVWNALKAAHQGETIMGNIAEDLDNLEFDGRAR